MLVVVPSRVLMEQWSESLKQALPHCVIGRLGDSFSDRVDDCDVLVTTPLCERAKKPMPPDGQNGLIIADECHGFGGLTLRKSLIHEYDERLGLTATLERSDDAVEKTLLPYFGGFASVTISRRRYSMEFALSREWRLLQCRWLKKNATSMT